MRIKPRRDQGCAHWTAHGTYKGSLSRIPPTDEQFTVTGVDIAHFVDNKVVEVWADWDMQAMLEQLGAAFISSPRPERLGRVSLNPRGESSRTVSRL